MPSSGLANTWYYLRTPVKSFHSLNHPAGCLTIFGNAYQIDSLNSPSVLFKKLPYPAGTWETVMDYQPTNEYEEAGITVFLSLLSHISVTVRCGVDGKRRLNVRWSKDQHQSEFTVRQR